MRSVVIGVGHELVTGSRVDTNSPWISAELGALGIETLYHVTVGDEETAISQAVERALQVADVVMVTGGLGPTADDLTREGLACAMEAELEFSQEAHDQIEAFYRSYQRPVHESARRQARIPRGCFVIPNPKGTAPGIGQEKEGRYLFALPGVPFEMKAMCRESVWPKLRATGDERGGVTRVLRTYGMKEADLGDLLEDLMDPRRNPHVGVTASETIISVRVQAWGENRAEAERRVLADVEEVRRRLGNVVFGEGEEELEHAVARLLKEADRTVVTAESCTGGLLSKRLTDVPGASAYFLRGYVTYCNRAKVDLLNVPVESIQRDGAVSASVARFMADHARVLSRADYALSITGIAGPDGGREPDKPVGLVYIGLASAKGVEVKKTLIGSHLSRAQIRDRACKTALNMLRLKLLEDFSAVPSSRGAGN